MRLTKDRLGQTALLKDQASDISEESFQDTDLSKKIKTAIGVAWTKARNCIKTEVKYRDFLSHDRAQSRVPQITQSLGDDPTSERDPQGHPNRRPSSLGIIPLTINVVQSITNAKGAKFTVMLAARIAFLVRHLPFLCLPSLTNFPRDTVTRCSRTTGPGAIIGNWWTRLSRTFGDWPTAGQPQFQSALPGTMPAFSLLTIPLSISCQQIYADPLGRPINVWHHR